MGQPSVAQFISDRRAEGMSDSKITHMLLDAGWHMDIIHKAMHGEPIRQRDLKPILDIKKQPIRKSTLYYLAGFLILASLMALATFI